MPRSLRIEYPGAYYHVMARGNRREAIFRDEEDRHFFLKTLGEACGMTGWRVHAWVLMGNHYHLMLETPEANLVAGMGWLQNAYTRRFNARHRLWGRLFGDRYKAVLAEGGSDYYYETLMDYIHLNPVRAGMVRVRAGRSVLDYPWCSVGGGHALPPSKRPAWLATERALAAFGCADTAAGRRRFVERLDRRAVEEEMKRCGVAPMPAAVDARCSHLRRGWFWGTQAFAEAALKLAKGVLERPRHRTTRSSLEKRAHDEAGAEALLASGLAAAGLTQDEVGRLPGSDARKVAIARLIWEGTTMSQGWVSERLQMGSAANVSQQLRRGRDGAAQALLSAELKRLIEESRFVA